MSKPTETSVLVLGGGPAGLAVALELGQRGVDVVVVEPRSKVEHGRPRAKTTSARTMELFRRWGVADAVRGAAALPVSWSQRVTFCTTATGPLVTHIDGCFGLDLFRSDLVAEPGQQVPQPAVENVLRARLRELEAVTLLLGWSGSAIEPHAEGARVTLVDDDGEQRVVSCRYLVGADGPRSLVRRHLGVRYVGGPAGRPNVNVTFRSLRLESLMTHAPSVHYWVLNPDAPGVLGRLDLNGTWWAIATDTKEIADDIEATTIVRSMVGADIDVDVVATDPWQAKMLLAESYRVGHTFLVGDAAHQNPPWGGHGFNTGIGDAMNLAWKLAAVLRGWAPEALLDSYEAERRPIAQKTIDLAAANTATLSTNLVDPELLGTGAAFERARARAEATIHRTKAAEFHSLGLVLGYGYSSAAAQQAPTTSQYTPIAAPGNRLPHAWLHDGTSLYDRLGPDLTVIGDPGASAPLVAAARGRSVPLRVVDPSPDGLAAHLGAAVVLVRPDQHIAWMGDGVNANLADRVLDIALAGFGPLDRRPQIKQPQEGTRHEEVV